MADPLLFPEFLYGEQAPTRRKMKAEAKKWGKRYANTGDFPAPKLISVPPGAIVFSMEGAVEFMKWGVSTENDPEWAKVCALAGRHVPRWHLHHLHNFMYEIPTVDERREARDVMFKAYETFVRRYPWGALEIAMSRPVENPIPVAVRRIEDLVSFWEPLDTVRYVDIDLYPVSLTHVVRYTYRDVLATWVDKPSADVRIDLRTIITNMPTASDDEIQARALRSARWVIETWPHLKHRQWLKSPGLLERELERLRREEPDEYAQLPAQGGGILAYKLDRVGPEGAQS